MGDGARTALPVIGAAGVALAAVLMQAGMTGTGHPRLAGEIGTLPVFGIASILPAFVLP